jgi:hypothetical protein
MNLEKGNKHQVMKNKHEKSNDRQNKPALSELLV